MCAQIRVMPELTCANALLSVYQITLVFVTGNTKPSLRVLGVSCIITRVCCFSNKCICAGTVNKFRVLNLICDIIFAQTTV